MYAQRLVDTACFADVGIGRALSSLQHNVFLQRNAYEQLLACTSAQPCLQVKQHAAISM